MSVKKASEPKIERSRLEGRERIEDRKTRGVTEAFEKQNRSNSVSTAALAGTRVWKEKFAAAPPAPRLFNKQVAGDLFKEERQARRKQAGWQVEEDFHSAFEGDRQKLARQVAQWEQEWAAFQRSPVEIRETDPVFSQWQSSLINRLRRLTGI